MGKKENKINTGEELYAFISNYYNSLEHTDAPYYLKYPFIDMHVEIPISEKRFKVILRSNLILKNLLFIQQAMNLLQGNYSEFQAVIQNTPDPWKDIKTKIDLYNILVARKLGNLLSSCYAYTEHTRKLLHTIKSSPSFKSLKEHHVTEDCRIIEEVRNYAQHHGLAIDRFKFDKKLINFYVSVESLHNAKDKNKDIIDRYNSDEVNITQLIPIYIQKLWELHLDILNNLSDLRISSIKIINESIDEMKKISENKNLSCCLIVDNSQTNSTTNIQEHMITVRKIDLNQLFFEENNILYKNNFSEFSQNNHKP